MLYAVCCILNYLRSVISHRTKPHHTTPHHTMWIYHTMYMALRCRYNPFLDELYSATHGGGAFCNGKKITVGKASEIGKIVVMNNIGACKCALHNARAACCAVLL